ncbi:MAG: hypothetical protein EBV75_01135 [Acidimicrobiia bacterium]|nr:hypothetical protein [Acidimicrobiia bacterium]
MILRIGLDFDNTIANYDRAFPNVAQILGYQINATNKRDLKAELIAGVEGETAWQKVQGLTYGRYIDQASLYPGVLEFIVRAKARDCEVFIISHKTEIGHFDDTKTSLRDAATAWMVSKKIIGDGSAHVKSGHVFYASTRDEKIAKINELNLDVFIDDLAEVLTDSSFPDGTRKILFGLGSDHESISDPTIRNSQSWREIGDELFGAIDATDVRFGVQHFWPNLICSSVEQIEGRGNSKIFKLETAVGSVALKVYPDQHVDTRPRRQTEWSALNFLKANKLQTPTPVATDPDLNWSLLEWVDGSSGYQQDDRHLYIAADFVRALSQASKSLVQRSLFAQATESCLIPELVEEQIRGRLTALKAVDDDALQQFLINQVEPKLIDKVRQARAALGELYSRQLEEKYWTLSPSDFGLHNAIITPLGDIVFFDFEYFGWDDPVKLTADFCLHPGMSISVDAQKIWTTQMKNVFGSDPNFVHRLGALYPLYAIRWSLIILNEFRPDKIKNRLHAQSRMQSDVRSTQMAQLKKAKLMIENLDRSIF